MQRLIQRTALAVLACLAVAVASGALLAQKAAAQQTLVPFEFIALGDMPYKTPQDFPRFDRLIEAINGAKPAFALHLGDIKSESEPCTDEYYRSIHGRFQRFESPLVYTPGDNEWTACYRERAGKFNPRERLDKLREIFFSTPTQSLGRMPMALESQGKLVPGFAKYIENRRFWKNGVLFILPHIPGSNNGFEATDLEAVSEFFERNKANVAWLDDSFRLAREQGAKAVVIAFHANLLDIKQKSPAPQVATGYSDTIKAIERGAKAFGKPMLVIHGDDRELELEGFRGSDLKRVPNVWRLQVMGESYIHAVTVTVDPSSPSVFGFRPFIVPENGPH